MKFDRAIEHMQAGKNVTRPHRGIELFWMNASQNGYFPAGVHFSTALGNAVAFEPTAHDLAAKDFKLVREAA